MDANGLRDKLMILFSLFSGARAFTVGKLLWSDIIRVQQVHDVPDISGLYSVSINSRIVKMSLNDQSENTFVGFIHDRKLGDFDIVYLLNQYCWVTWGHGLCSQSFDSPKYHVPLFPGKGVFGAQHSFLLGIRAANFASMVNARATRAGYPDRFFNFHSTRAGFACEVSSVILFSM